MFRMHPPKRELSSAEDRRWVPSTETLPLPFPSPEPPAPADLRGEVSFASAEAQAQRTTELLGEGALVVDVSSPTAFMRGRLAEHVEDAIERELAARGAPSPTMAAWSAMPDTFERRISNQLFRARKLGATGVAIVVGSMQAIAEGAPHALGTDDSRTLRVLVDVASTGPLVIVLDDGDARLPAYEEPVTAEALVAERNATKAQSATLPIASPSVTPAVVAEPASAPPPPVVVAVAPVAPATSEAELPAPPPRAAPRANERAATAGVPAFGPTDLWRSWAVALAAARGPQPLAAFERLFVESYMPLTNAIARGLDDARAIRAHDDFRDGFERSYRDAFATFGASARRPRLVMDAFDVASKIARLHSARTTHVLLVDALRYDLGELVRDAIERHAGKSVSLASQSLLWSSLPTTTFRQLETIARGIDALRAPTPEESTDSLRGRSAETVRRLRVGPRELFKLDVVPSMLATLGVGSPSPTPPSEIASALPDIAEHVAEALARHIETLSPRTVLFILGDHGFTIDRRGRITDGGATPEEVLVPCFAYVVGDLH